MALFNGAKSGFTSEDLARMGPDALTRKRMLADALLKQSSGIQDIRHPLQGFAQLANALVGGYKEAKIDKAELAGKDRASAQWNELAASSGMGGAFPEAPGGQAAGGNVAQALINSPSGAPSQAPSQGGGDVEAYIRQAAQERGIDPEVALRVARSEGGVKDPYRQSDIVKNGRREPSFGPFQLYMDGGMGNQALAAGIDPRKDWKGGINFALDNAAKGGWGPWYGAKAVGINGMDGIGSRPAGNTQVASLDPSAGMGGPPPPPQQAPAPPQQQVAQALMQGDDQQQPWTPAQPLPQGGPDMGMLMRAAGNEWNNPNQQNVIQALLGQKLSANDPMKKLEMEKAQLELDALKNPRLSLADQERFRLDREKMAADQKKMEFDQSDTATDNAREDAKFKLDSNKALGENDRATQKLNLEKEAARLDAEKTRLETEALRNPKMTPDQAARLDLDKKKYEDDKNKLLEVSGGASLFDPVTKQPVFTAPDAKGASEAATGLRKEVQALPSYKNYSQALPIYKSMVETADRDSKASDLNLVYGLGKIMDPTSVVREGEMVMVNNTSSLPDWLQGAINSVNGGAKLTQETRKAILTEAYGRMKGYDGQLRHDATQYQGIVDRGKMNPADVLPEFEEIKPWQPKSANAPASPTTDEEFNALPSGAMFIDPDDGKTYKKP